MLKLARQGQIQRIRRDENLTAHLLLAVVKTRGGSQRMEVLLAEAIPAWAMGIQEQLIAPEKRPLVNALKEHAHEALSHALLKPESEPVTQHTPEPQVETEAPAQPIHSGPYATHDSPRERLFAALEDVQEGLHGMREALQDMWEKEQAEDERLARTQRELAGRVEVVEEWVKALDGRVAGMGQGGAAAEVGWLPLLSAAHLAEMRTLLRSLEQATGRTQAQLEQELVETFRVAAINALPEEQWEDVLAWYLWRARQSG